MGSYQLRGLGLWRWEEDMDSLSSSLDKGTGFFREDSSICPARPGKGNSVCRAWWQECFPLTASCRACLWECPDTPPPLSPTWEHGCPPLLHCSHTALLSKQAFQAHHLVPKLGDNLREVVECNHCFFHLRTRLFCKAWRKGLE